MRQLPGAPYSHRRSDEHHSPRVSLHEGLALSQVRAPIRTPHGLVARCARCLSTGGTSRVAAMLWSPSREATGAMADLLGGAPPIFVGIASIVVAIAWAIAKAGPELREWRKRKPPSPD